MYGSNEHNPTMVKAKIKQSSGVRMILALQLRKGLNREEPTFITTPLVDEQIETRTVPIEIHKVLNDYVDIMPLERPDLLDLRKHLMGLLCCFKRRKTGHYDCA